MRNEFADQMSKLGKDKKHIFLTGDLGFMALENVRDVFGQRFINCGVSEQNMVAVAAGLARSGFTVFAYSIAPFIYASATGSTSNLQPRSSSRTLSRWSGASANVIP